MVSTFCSSFPKIIFSTPRVNVVFHRSSWDWFSIPDNKVHGANMGPIYVPEDPGGPHVGPMNFAFWDRSGKRVFWGSGNCQRIWKFLDIYRQILLLHSMLMIMKMHRAHASEHPVRKFFCHGYYSYCHCAWHGLHALKKTWIHFMSWKYVKKNPDVARKKSGKICFNLTLREGLFDITLPVLVIVSLKFVPSFRIMCCMLSTFHVSSWILANITSLGLVANYKST